MEQSILTSTKKVLGIPAADTSFDLDIVTFVNSAFSNLHQLGLGPLAGFQIEDESNEWVELAIEDLAMLNQLKTYVYLYTRMLFDPPTTSYLIEATQKQLEEHAWRLNVLREATEWTAPPELLPETIDGGNAG